MVGDVKGDNFLAPEVCQENGS